MRNRFVPSLRRSTIAEPLGLTIQEEAMIGLGDGTTTRMEAVRLDVEWLGQWLTVPFHIAGSSPLVGVSFPKDHCLVIDFVPGGEVRVSPI